MTTVATGHRITLRVSFFEYYQGPLVDPESGPNLDILFSGASVLDSPFTYPGDVIRESEGIYYYNYQVPTNATLGDYTAVWTAVQGGASVEGREEFTVAAAAISTGTEKELGEDFEINYVAVLDPAFIDPDDLAAIFPDAEMPMILESIYRVSMEVLHWFPKSTVDELSPKVHQYLIAAVACDLGQRYGLTSSDEYSITLGDLSVTYAYDKEGNSGVGGGTNWCAIAEQLRTEVRYGLSPVKGVVRGSRLTNPIPRRSIYKKHSRTHLQGTLDDAEGPPQRF